MVYIFFYFINSILAIKYDKIKHIKHLDLFIFFTLVIFASVRWDVGGDFQNYIEFYENFELPRPKDPTSDIIFYSLNLLFYLLKFDVLGKNIVLIILFLLPFYYVFKKFYKNIYLSLCIFFPIIFIVYGLGSIRQGLAISYFFLFLYYNGNKVIKYILFFIPYFFHETSIIPMAIYFASQIISLSNKKKLFISSLFFLIISLIIIFLKYDYFYSKIVFYIQDDVYHSVGAPFRAILLSMFSILFLIKIKNLNISDEKINKFLLFSSFFIFFLTPISFFLSTPVDRILAYFLIIKLIISEEVLKILDNKLQKKLFSIFFIMIGFVYLVSWIYLGENSWFYNRSWSIHNLIFFNTIFH